MTEPRIQYAQTKDGVSIAFYTLGEGMPLVYMPMHPWSHIQAERQEPELRRWNERFAEKRMLVRYDGRGTGLSERGVTDHSLDALVLDLEAVADRLDLERFALCASGNTGPVAIAYAVRHPERVSHILLWCSWARASDAWRSPVYQSFRALRGQDWKTYTETLAHSGFGWSDAETAARMAAFMR
ncbi:unnamed protein product, partial [marine sediment metagenome]